MADLESIQSSPYDLSSVSAFPAGEEYQTAWCADQCEPWMAETSDCFELVAQELPGYELPVFTRTSLCCRSENVGVPPTSVAVEEDQSDSGAWVAGVTGDDVALGVVIGGCIYLGGPVAWGVSALLILACHSVPNIGDPVGERGEEEISDGSVSRDGDHSSPPTGDREDGGEKECTLELPHDGVDNDCNGITDRDSWLQVSTGARHTCGVRTDHTVECWGSDRDTSGDFVGQATPPEGTFIQVEAGSYHTCGVKTDNTVECWGSDGSSGRATPPGGTFTQVNAGMSHTCGVRTDNTVECWGDNAFGRAMPPEGTFIQVSAGWFHTCGVRTNETIACWGDDDDGQSTPPGGSFVQVSVGLYYTCGVRTNETIACWGRNNDGESTAPGGTFTQVSAGGGHTCSITTDDTVECWGSNEDTSGDFIGQSDPPGGTFIQVSAGAEHTCGVRTDNTVECWGNDGRGQSTPPSP